MNEWLIDAALKMPPGADFQTYLEGYGDGARFLEALGPARSVIWKDSSLSFEQKLAEFQDTGLDLNTVIAMAILGGSATRPSLRRSEPGVASHGGSLPRIADGQAWLRGTAGNAGKVPAQVAEKLAGRNFKSFDDFREAFWTTVSEDAVLRT
nr:hypothetical protein [Ensifer sp. ENS05]